MSDRARELFIYPKDKNGKRLGITVCVILVGGLMFEGTAVCSKNDQFCRATGRNIAKQRATEAYIKHSERKGFVK